MAGRAVQGSPSYQQGHVYLLPESLVSACRVGENASVCRGLDRCLGRVPADSVTKPPGERTLQTGKGCEHAELWCLAVGRVAWKVLLWLLEY